MSGIKGKISRNKKKISIYINTHIHIYIRSHTPNVHADIEVFEKFGKLGLDISLNIMLHFYKI